MQISLLPENTQNYTKVENIKNIKNIKCYFCDDKNNLVNTFYNNEIINCCTLCNVIVNFNKSYTFYCILCYSEMSQFDIIKITKKIYKDTGIIPFPQELDKNAKYVNIPVYLYAKFENKIDNFKLFFTCKILDIINDETDDVFDVPKIKSKEKRNLCDYINIEKYEFDKKQKKARRVEILSVKKKNYDLFVEKEDKFIKKIQNIHNK